MPGRVVSVVLRGEVGDLLGKLKATSSAVNATAKSMTDSSRESAAFRENLTALGTTAGKFGLVAAAGVAVAVKKFADFDQAMSHVAATGQEATARISELREAALDAGSRTVYSATEAAGAIENLAKAGLTTQQILDGGLDGALDLAAAGGLDVAKAAEIAAISLKQFGLDGSQAGHVADLLSAGAGTAVGDVADLGAALSQSGLVAKQTGLSIEETTGALSAFADAGLLGSDSGTSLKSALQALTPSSVAAADAIEQYNLSAYDQKGNFIGLAAFAGKLKAGLSGLTAEQRNATLKTIYGSDAVRAASVLYEQGEEGINKYIGAVNQQGFAADQAAKRLDNLKGDLEGLSGALDTAFIGTGEGANGPLRETVQLLTALVNGYNDLPGPVKNGALGVLGLTAALGGGVFAISKAIDGYSNLKGNISNLNMEFDKSKAKAIGLRVGVAGAGAGLAALSGPAHEADEALGDLVDTASAVAFGFAVGGPWGAALGGGIALLSAFGGQSADAAARQKQLDSAGASVAATLDAQTGALTELTRATAAKGLADAGVLDAAKQMGISLKDTLDAALGNAGALERVTKASEGWADASARSGDYTEKEEAALKLFRDGVGATSAAIDEQREKTGQVAEATGGLTDGLVGVGGAANDAATEVESLAKELDGLLNPLLDQDSATVAWRLSLMSLNDDLSKQGRTLDLNTKSGLDNRNAIRDRVEALQASAAADAEAGVEADKVGDKLKRGRSAIVDAGVAAGFSEKEMRKYLRQLGLTPDNIKTLIEAQDAASPTIDSVDNKLGALDGVVASPKIAVKLGGSLGAISSVAIGLNALKDKTVTVTTKSKEAKAAGGAVGVYADGGSIVGAGTGTSDSIPALLSNGEHVLTAAEVNKMGGQDAVYRMRSMVMSGMVPKFASGGAVVSKVDIKEAEARVRDIERSLDETETVKRNGKKQKRKVLRGLDEEIARLQLAEAKKNLRDLKSGKAAKDEAAEKAADAQKEADEKAQRILEDAENFRLSTKASAVSRFTLGSATSAAAVDRNLARLLADSGVFLGLLGDLKAKGASPWLLAQLVEAGPTPGAIRLARQYNTDQAAFDSIQARAGQIDAYSNQYASLVGNAMFSQPAAWNSGISSASQAPMVASLVGAQISVGTNGLMQFVSGQILMSQDAQQLEARVTI